MSTRVQKGGPVFRPVARGKPRPRLPSSTPAREQSSAPSVVSLGPSVQADSTPFHPPSVVPDVTSFHIFDVEGSTSVIEGASPTSGIPIFQPSSQRSSTISINPSINIIQPPIRRIATPTPLSVPEVPQALIAAPIAAPLSRSQASNSSEQTSSPQNILNISGVSNTLPSIPVISSDPPPSAPAAIHPPPAAKPAEVKRTPRPKEKTPAGNVERPRRKRKAATVSAGGSGSDVSEEDSSPKRKRTKKRANTENPRSGRDQSVKIAQGADPGEELDPTSITMAALCEDTGQGRVSSRVEMIQTNHANWKVQAKEIRERARTDMELKKLGKDLNPDGAHAELSTSQQPVSSASPPIPAPSNAQAGHSSTEVQDETGHGFDYSNLQAIGPSVQVRIGPNGEAIVDEESTVVDRDMGEAIQYTHVEESEFHKFTNSSTFSRKLKGQRWSNPETELFYNALSQFGENYEMIAMMLPGRDRKACKNKFKSEDKRNPDRINACLKHQTPVDIHALALRTGKDFSGPIPQFNIPLPPVAPVTKAPAESASSRPTPATSENRARKRSRSRTAPPEEGVTILGGIDQFSGLDDDD